MRSLHPFFVLCFAVLLLSACTAATPTPVPPTSAPAAPAATVVPPTVTPVPPSDTPVPPTNTLAPTGTPTEVPTETPTVAPSATAVPPTATSVPPTVTPPPPTPVPAKPTAIPPTKQPVSQNPCNLDPGNAGILVINDFDGLLTFTVLNHEYKVPGHGQQIVQVPGGVKFTASVSVVGVGKTNFGPVTLDAGQCVKYEPHT
jgi:hypothetical protein